MMDNYAIARTPALCTAVAKWKSLLKGPVIVEEMDMIRDVECPEDGGKTEREDSEELGDRPRDHGINGGNLDDDHNQKTVTEDKQQVNGSNDNVNGDQNQKILTEDIHFTDADKATSLADTTYHVVNENSYVKDANDNSIKEVDEPSKQPEEDKKCKNKFKKRPVNGKQLTKHGKGMRKLQKRGTSDSLYSEGTDSPGKGLNNKLQKRGTSYSSLLSGGTGQKETKSVSKGKQGSKTGAQHKIVRGMSNINTQRINGAKHQGDVKTTSTSLDKEDNDQIQSSYCQEHGSQNGLEEQISRVSSGKKQNDDVTVQLLPNQTVSLPNCQGGSQNEGAASRPVSAGSAPVYGQIVDRSDMGKVKKIEREFRDHKLIAAIPILPMSLAVVCCALNVFVPGTGTIISSFSLLCCNKRPEPASGKKEDAVDLMITNLCVGISQLFTVTFLFIGFIWSVTWGVFMVQFAWVRYKKDKEERARQAAISVANAFLRPGFR